VKDPSGRILSTSAYDVRAKPKLSFICYHYEQNVGALLSWLVPLGLSVDDVSTSNRSDNNGLFLCIVPLASTLYNTNFALHSIL
jgi:hypothetical protein